MCRCFSASCSCGVTVLLEYALLLLYFSQKSESHSQFLIVDALLKLALHKVGVACMWSPASMI